MLSRIINIASVLFLLTACAQHHCLQNSRPPAPPIVAPSATPSDNNRIVRIYKYDGSLQCNMGKAITTEEMAKELKNIKILSQKKLSDGLMHIQVCGSSTGMANVFEINETDLPRAEKLGFKPWTFE